MKEQLPYYEILVNMYYQGEMDDELFFSYVISYL